MESLPHQSIGKAAWGVGHPASLGAALQASLVTYRYRISSKGSAETNPVSPNSAK